MKLYLVLLLAGISLIGTATANHWGNYDCHCWMGVYGDPHIYNGCSSWHWKTCAVQQGWQLFLQNPYVRIWGNTVATVGGGMGGTTVRNLIVWFPASGAFPGAVYATPFPWAGSHIPQTLAFPFGSSNSGAGWNWVTMVGGYPAGSYAVISNPLPDITIYIRRSGPHYFFNVRMPSWMNGWSSGWLINPCPLTPGRKRRATSGFSECYKKCVANLGKFDRDFPITYEELLRQCKIDCSANPENSGLIGDFVQGLIADQSGARDQAMAAEANDQAQRKVGINLDEFTGKEIIKQEQDIRKIA